MSLTRPKFAQVDTTFAAFSDPITILHQGATVANVDVGFLFNRANGLVSNVALYWNEETGRFITAYTSSSGDTNANVTATSFANIQSGNVFATGFFYANGAAFVSGSNYGNTEVAAYLPTDATITGLQANLGAYQGWANTRITTLDANLGTVTTNITTLFSNAAGQANQITGANAAIVTANSAVVSFVGTINDNLSTAITANTNAANTAATTANINMKSYVDTQDSAITTAWTSNAATQATSLNSINANLGTATTNITNLQSNAGTQQSQINSIVTNANANVAAYLPTYSGSLGGTLTTAAQTNITSVGTLTGLTSSGIVNITNSTQSSDNTTGALVVTGGAAVGANLHVGGSLHITGNLEVNGTQTIFNTNVHVIEDSLLYMGDDNTGDSVDIGIVSSFTNPAYQHTGFVRDASDSVWKLFANVVAEPTTVVDFTSATYSPLRIGALTATSGTYSGAVIASSLSAGTIGNTGATLTGTLNTAVQTNITSLGTLSGLTVNAQFSGNTAYADSDPGNYDAAQFLAFANQNNITGVSFSPTDRRILTMGFGPVRRPFLRTGSGVPFELQTGNVIIASTTASTSATTGALVVKGGVGVAGQLSTSSNILLGGSGYPATTYSSTVSSRTATIGFKDGYNMYVDSPNSGYLIISQNGGRVGVANTAPSHNLSITGTLYTSGIATLANIITTNGVYWANGAAYSSGSGGGITYTASATAPVSPSAGNFWYDTGTDIKYQYIYDGAGSYWEDLSYPTSFGNLTVANTLTVDGSIIGTVTNANYSLVANVAIYESVTATTTNATFYPMLSGITTGNTASFTSSGLTFNPSTGALGATTVSATTLTGTISTAAQPNITSVGTLTSLNVGAQTNTGLITGRTGTGGVAAVSNDAGSLSVRGNATNAAVISFHRPSIYAINMGLDTDNVFKIGGWSATANCFQLTGAGALTLTGGITTTGNIVPSANLTYNLGSTTAWWNNVYGVSVQAKYADLAEHYAADADYPPGTVVVFGGAEEITVSGISHDPRVAGVISTDPAYLMNAANPGLPVALTGRVPCQVQGPVAKGDRLVNIDTGVAGRLDPTLHEYGCIIGKSLGEIADDSVQTIEIVVGRF